MKRIKQIESEHKHMIIGIKGAIAALSQSKTYPADVNAAIMYLRGVLVEVELES